MSCKGKTLEDVLEEMKNWQLRQLSIMVDKQDEEITQLKETISRYPVSIELFDSVVSALSKLMDMESGKEFVAVEKITPSLYLMRFGLGVETPNSIVGMENKNGTL